MKFPISKRLACCAAQVPEGARVADIGCDHGYLSISLLQSGRAAFVHACDLREKPLQRARENAARFGVRENLRLSCADGLRAVAPDEIDTVVCAGMGGDLIVQIIEGAPWLKNAAYTLILQPQSSGQDVRRRLSELGYGIERETLVRDGGFLYYIMTARFGCAAPLTPGQQYCSPALLCSGDPLLPAYLQRIRRALEQTVEGVRCANDPQRLAYFESALREVREMEASI